MFPGAAITAGRVEQNSTFAASRAKRPRQGFRLRNGLPGSCCSQLRQAISAVWKPGLKILVKCSWYFKINFYNSCSFQLEQSQKKKIEIAVEEEKIKIVEKSKQFVLAREKENENRNKDLIFQVEIKGRKMATLESKLKRQEDDIKQLQFELAQTKISCDNVVQQHDKNQKEEDSRSSRKKSNVIKDMELKIRLEKAKQKYEEVQRDFQQSTDTYEKDIASNKREIEKLQAELQNMKTKCEKKDEEFKRLKSSSQQSVEKENLLADLREKLQKSDEQHVEMEIKLSDLQTSFKRNKGNHSIEISNLNSKLAALKNEKKKLTKQLEDALSKLKLSEVQASPEEALGTQNIAVTPLAKSMSNLNVLNVEDSAEIPNEKVEKSAKRENFTGRETFYFYFSQGIVLLLTWYCSTSDRAIVLLLTGLLFYF